MTKLHSNVEYSNPASVKLTLLPIWVMTREPPRTSSCQFYQFSMCTSEHLTCHVLLHFLTDTNTVKVPQCKITTLYNYGSRCYIYNTRDAYN
jgi:hypothetical protein